MNKFITIIVFSFLISTFSFSQTVKGGAMLGLVGASGDLNTSGVKSSFSDSGFSYGLYLEGRLPILGALLADVTFSDFKSKDLSTYGINYIYYFPMIPFVDLGLIAGYRAVKIVSANDTADSIVLGLRLDMPLKKIFSLGAIARYHFLLDDISAFDGNFDADGWDIQLTAGLRFKGL